MSSARDPTDAADEAGGEAIFSSDGLLPLAVPKFPFGVTIKTNEEDDNDVLDSGDGMDSTKAFEVFSGKLYPPNNFTAMTTKRDSGRNSKENPLVRLARLQQEVAEVERDLQSNSNMDDAAEMLPKELSQLASNLSSRLEKVSSFSNAAEQERLTALLQQHFQQMKANAAATTATTTEGQMDPAPPLPGGVVYELLQAPESDTPTSRLETRLLQLEQNVGSSMASSQKTLQERLAEMERMIQRVDGKSLDQATARAKVIRADLEAASKAKNKLGSSLNSSSNVDSKKINELHDYMMQLEGVQSHLPALVHRLQQLSTLHNQSATFSSRLMTAEESLSVSSQTLGSIEETMLQLEKGMAENTKVMEQNMVTLDKRLKKLSSVDSP